MVFHHTGRDCWIFQDIQSNGEASRYRDWYHLDFTRRSPWGDPFSYEGWAGHYDLVKLNLGNPLVLEHLFAAISSWVEQFDVDGLRLDAADRLDADFRSRVASHCRALKEDFWLMGEVVHGDYRQWVHEGGLCATTNYEAYRSLWSARNDKNYFELSYSLNRQFGQDGIYRGLDLYSFADNHDVDRVASTLKDPRHLYPLYLLLLTMPGIPSLYYGSEWGIAGRRTANSHVGRCTATRPASSTHARWGPTSGPLCSHRAPYRDSISASCASRRRLYVAPHCSRAVCVHARTRRGNGDHRGELSRQQQNNLSSGTWDGRSPSDRSSQYGRVLPRDKGTLHPAPACLLGAHSHRNIEV